MKKYEVGNMISGLVTGIEKYGVFVKVDNDYNGMIHISEISDRFINNINECYVVGDNINAKVIEIDEEKKQLKLSVKNLQPEHNIDKSENGFLPLQDRLDEWIEEQMSEINA